MLRPRQVAYAMLLVPLVGTVATHRSTQRPRVVPPKAEAPRPTSERPRAEVRAPRPQLWVATSGDARVYVLGFGEAKDTSWLTPSIRRAFEQSSELWLETAGPGEATHQSPAERRVAAERVKRLGYEPGRTLFDVLEPSVRDRTLAYIRELGINQDSIQPLRPWKAYYSIVSAFWSKRPMTHHQVDVDGVLGSMARDAEKRIGYEFQNEEQFTTFMALMPDRAQSQYIEWLLDFLDDYQKGRNGPTESFSWIDGNPGDATTRSLERMRTRMPDLYQVLQRERNAWWARKVFELMGTKGTRFVAIGQLHVLGPDGLPRQLERLGVRLELAQ
jgi:uncharacterized protein YbaP (TraB family)